ncbi:CPBP family intramembrane metalloprotease [Scytonema hofmannii FACHB-248]|uniref:CPBP family intramembrane metalloprotease n=1 Tax=Scytonema hofmannii FACHB-248 TaxID=1842502 RepID=A0ABR8GMG5_9CYAN|nr:MULTISPECIES: type II CAAX endopeptidase family protein [Nostocales]MBD2604426.1 CPBP family intramembrane metalloprotease [Scytonema hofmannii FACHB-248]
MFARSVSYLLSVSLSSFEPSINTLLSFIENAPVIVVVMAFFIGWIGCWFPVAIVSALALNLELGKPLQSEQKLPLLISLYLLAPFILWGINWLTNTSFSNYGFNVNISLLGSLGLGFVLGVFSLAVVFGGQLWLSWCSWQESQTKQLQSILLPIFLVALFVGGIEELVFRGFLFTQLAEDYPVWLAAVISSLIFALLHLVWERHDTIPQLPGLWLMGMVLVLARFSDRGNLGLAWGLHAGWVWAIACLDTAELISYTGKVPEWLTGKNKKPLAGATGIVCLLLTALILWVFSGYI